MGYREYFNKEEALKRVRGNEKILRLMIDMFLKSKEVVALEEALAARDINRSADMSHAIKGLAGNLSFPLLYNVADRLNQELKANVFCEETVAEYRQVLANTQSAVKKLCDIE